MVYYGDEEEGYKRVRERKEKPIDYSKPAKTEKQALESLMLSCAKMERSVSDVRRSLYRWRIPKEEHQAIIDRLVAEKFVDEERYAHSYVREKLARGNWGRRKIEQGLRAKGIPAEIIREALAQVEPEKQSGELEQLLERRYAREKGKATGYEIRNKLLRWGVGRGYDYEQVQQALQQIIKGEDEPDDE